MSDPNISVDHDENARRFIVTVDGREAGYCSYVTRPGDVRDLNHTVVDQAFRGRGLSSPLIKAALDDARTAGLKIRPSCSAVEHFINKNEDYRDLVA